MEHDEAQAKERVCQVVVDVTVIGERVADMAQDSDKAVVVDKEGTDKDKGVKWR